ncbi:MAG: hypothetical protein J0M08_06965 [Bacteroidetes bacterium]|nr:hypothetical protein [Bacteroidota bacterium]
MSLKKYLYTKRQLFSRFFALKLSRERAFTALQLIIKTLQSNKYLPEKIIALEVFGFIGTSTSLDYAELTDYLELWEIDPYYAKQAQKINPNAKVICGDSVEAIANGKLLRDDYNFLVIDSNISSALNDGSYESFGVFENSLKYLAKKSVVIVTIYNNLEAFAKLYNTSVNQLDANWITARKTFYGLDNVINARGTDYLISFEKIIAKNNFQLIQSQFISRNNCVGFGVFVLDKK